MIQIKGELSEIRKDSEGFTYVYYEDLVMVFSDREVPFFVRAEIVGKTYSFGRQKIKVGDTRRKAFILLKNCIYRNIAQVEMSVTIKILFPYVLFKINPE